MNLTNSNFYKLLKRNKFLYFTKVRLFNKDYKSNLSRIDRSFKSTKRIHEEMLMLKKYWHCNPAHYVRYALFDKDLTEEELKDYIPPYFHYNFYNNSLFGNLDKDVYENKLSIYKIFLKFGIPTPSVIAVVRKRRLYDLNGDLLQSSQLFEDNKVTLFFKPVMGAGGTGISIYKDGDFNSFISKLEVNTTYVVQKAIRQRNDINMINPSSVNTIRAITQLRDEKPFLSVCVMRIGRKGKMVDNSHQGGLSIRINTSTGEFYPTGTAEHGGGCIKEHPDTGFVFENKKIADWNNIKTSILECAAKFPELKEIAWDVAVTEKGIQMIELNLLYGIDHLQCTCGGMRRVLNIFPKPI